ncbi:hypothetical protein IIC38_12415 [candidate division KSB1 bacterium]|nr:hypothetical protein [candidate division KSB1 bacterium]
MAPRLRKFTEMLDSLTVPDFIGFRFGSNLARIFAAIIILFASFFYMTAVFKGIGNLLEAFLDIPYKYAIVIVFLIVVYLHGTRRVYLSCKNRYSPGRCNDYCGNPSFHRHCG